jgi:iron complex transport system substrate-binding protein
MYQNTLIELGGGENAAAQLTDSYWSEVSYEQLLAWNPQVIVIASDAGYSRDDLLADPHLAGVDAVALGRVYSMPSSVEAWDSPVPGALVGSLWMASVLHGDRYPFDRFQSDAAQFYQAFYRISLDPSLLTK